MCSLVHAALAASVLVPRRVDGANVLSAATAADVSTFGVVRLVTVLCPVWWWHQYPDPHHVDGEQLCQPDRVACLDGLESVQPADLPTWYVEA